MLNSFLSFIVGADRSPVILRTTTFQTICNEELDIRWFVNIITGKWQWFTTIDGSNQVGGDKNHQLLLAATGSICTTGCTNEG